MRILQLTKHYPPDLGGIESVTFDLVEGLCQNGYVCEVLCCNTRNVTLTDTTKRGYKIYRAARIFKLASASLSIDLIRIFKRINQQYDLIHVHLPDPLAALALYIIRPSCKIVIHWHSDIVKQKLLYKFVKPLETWLLKRADSIIATSPPYATSSNALAKFAEKVQVIPIGITDVRPIMATAEKEKSLSFLDGKKVVFALGRHVYYKGFEFLIEAAALLDDSYCVVIGGSGPLTDSYQELIRDLKLEHKVKLIGRVSDEDLNLYYQKATMFCLPSTHRSEAYGVVLIEAMKYGIPLVTTNISGSGVSWVNKEGICGYNAPIKNSQALADCIRAIGDDNELHSRLSNAAKERFSSLFTSDKMIDSVIRLYEEINVPERTIV